MLVPAPPEILGYELWLWAAVARAHEIFCVRFKQPQGSFIKVASMFLEKLAPEEEAKAATSDG